MAVLPVSQKQLGVPVQVEKSQADKARLVQLEQEQKEEKKLIEKQQKANDDFQNALQQLKETAHVFGRRYHFKLHEKTQEYMVQIIDLETNKVINEVPPEKVLNLVAQIRELVGLLVNKKA
mgnify:FL=1